MFYSILFYPITLGGRRGITDEFATIPFHLDLFSAALGELAKSIPVQVSVGGRNITNLRFADDIDTLAEEEQELEALVESLDKTCTRYKMEISAEKTKLMTNSANGIQREIKVKGQKLGTVTSFKYLGAVVSDDGSKPEVLSRIAQATAALTKLKPIWRDNNISLGSKVKLMRSLVISIFLYACESWTLTAELEKRTQAFEMRCYRRLLNISYKDHVNNEEVRRKIQAAIGEYDELLTLVKKRKLRWFGHVSRSSGLAKTILQGTVKGKRKRGRQKKRWEDNIKEWTGQYKPSLIRKSSLPKHITFRLRIKENLYKEINRIL